MSPTPDRLLLVIGSGPGIGRHVAVEFASRGFNKIALVARRESNLQQDKDVFEVLGLSYLTVRTYQCDISEEARFTEVLEIIGKELGSPECILFNAAKVYPTALLSIGEEQMIEDYRVTCTALHTTAKWAIPQLLEMAKTRPEARPSLFVTSSLLPRDPIPELFLLSMVKAAQSNLTMSLAKAYGPKGIHVGSIVVGGVVSPESKTLSPSNIAAETWGFFHQESKREMTEIEVL